MLRLKPSRFALIAIILVSLLGLALVPAAPAQAANVTCPAGANTTWTGATNTDWTVNANWSNNAPSAGQTACIGAAANQPVITSSVTIASLQSAAATTVTINTGGNLTTNATSYFNNLIISGGTYTQGGSGGAGVDGDFTFNSGTLAGPNGIGITGTTSLATTGTKTISQDLYLYGPTNWTNGDVTSTGAAVHNSGLFTATPPGPRVFTATTIYNTGTITRTTSGIFQITANIENQAGGTFATGAPAGFQLNGSHTFNNAGTVDNLGSFSSAGAFTQSAGSTVNPGIFAAASFTQTGGTTTWSGVGNAPLSINGGVFNASNSLISDVALSSGTLNIGTGTGPAAQFTMTGNFTQTGGTLAFDVVSAGAAAGTDYDQFVVSGTYAVSGASTLAINTPGYDPASYVANLVTYSGTASGTYTTVATDVANGTWALDYGTGPLTATLTVTAPAVSEPAAAGTGYWLTGAEGKIYNFGNAKLFGSPANTSLNQPVVGFSPTTTGAGYYIAAKDGGVFTYGDAKFAGSLGGQKINKPIVSLVPTKTGKGYWLVASDGGVFSFGDAVFKGSLGDKVLNAPIVGAAEDVSTGGYWLVASDGGVFGFGGAKFNGSAANVKLKAPVVNIRAIASGTGYYLFGADGGVFTFGTASFYGVPGTQLGKAVVS